MLDTNVVSEAMRANPNPAVIGWLNSIDASTLYLSTITMAEILYGLEAMPVGRRRDMISKRFAAFVGQGFAHRVLAFDEAAAYSYGGIMAGRKRIGRPMSVADGQIAAIARTRGMTLATRDVSGFEDAGVELIDPWDG